MYYSPIQIAEASLQAGQPEQALEVLDSHLREHPADDEARRLRAQVRLRLTEPDSIRAALDDLRRVSTLTSADWQAWSVAAERLGDLPEAVRAIELARALQPADDRLTERLVLLHMQAGQLPAARDILAQQPRRWYWLRMHGDVEAEAHDTDSAIRLYTEALQDFERHHPTPNPFMQALGAEIMARRAALYWKAGMTDAANLDYTLLETLAPGRWSHP
jgi:tetratricopeptide (TPR) repeat protein